MAERYVVWQGREKGDSEVIHRVPVKENTPEGLMLNVVAVRFQRDYVSGRMVWKGDTDTPQDAGVIDYFMTHADPEYFVVFDQPLPPDREYINQLFNGYMDVTSFIFKLSRMGNIQELQRMLLMLHECGVPTEFTVPVASRIATLEAEHKAVSAQLQTITEAQRAAQQAVGMPMQQEAAAPVLPEVKGKRRAAAAVAATA